MKKLTVFILTICVLFTAAAANAASPSPAPDVTPSPTPAPNPAITPYSGNVPAFSGLIGMNYSGDDVVRVQIRLRDLCYFNFKPTGIYQSMTANAAKAFQLKHTTDDGVPMISDGTIGDQTMTILFRHGVSRADIAANIPIGTSQVKDGAVKRRSHGMERCEGCPVRRQFLSRYRLQYRLHLLPPVRRR
ncbi:MAG: peptidoglycan-binding domain-containing protein [Christensenellales bacterium]